MAGPPPALVGSLDAGPHGADAFGNFPPKAEPGRAYPRSPRLLGAWSADTGYAPGDVAQADTGMILCVVGHLSGAQSDGLYWLPYIGEVG